jgi:hypothetical protein
MKGLMRKNKQSLSLRDKKIILVLFLLVFIGVGLYLEKKQEPTDTSKPKIVVSEKDKIKISSVTMNNFTKDAEVISRGEVLRFEENDEFHIIARTKEGQFMISILGSPFMEMRLKAEEALLRKLNITEEEACKLDVIITTPIFANEAESGKNYGLSFCE